MSTTYADTAPAFAGTQAAACRHCGEPCPPGALFCCTGCTAAFEIIDGLGLDLYYQRRQLDPTQRPPRPQQQQRYDLQSHIRTRPDGASELLLTVDGVQCGACVWLIEQMLGREPGIVVARVNMTTCRLRLVWQPEAGSAERLVDLVERLGYRLVPFGAERQATETDRTERALVRALAVAGFAAGNVMLLSIGIWAGLTEGMGPATRSLLHWVSALLALPAIAYAGQPFFRSAWHALSHRRTNMDVPISVGVLLVTSLSLVETINGSTHTYFDSAVTLLFFLLIGRVLDQRARGRARETVSRFLALRGGDVAVIAEDGTLLRRQQREVAPGDNVLVGMGERIGVDGVVAHGETLLDTSLVTGEIAPEPAKPGGRVFAGMVNLGPAITITTRATGSATLLAEMARLIEAAEDRRGRHVALADRVARWYTPVVHTAALLTCLAWIATGLPVGEALLIASAVLIITCPCALALAVPAAQVIATGELLRQGILLKSGTALERLAEIDMVVFDKTGTLTEPDLSLVGAPPPDDLRIAASLAAASRHPLTRALVASTGGAMPADAVIEHQGEGLSRMAADGETRLGSAAFIGADAAADTLAGLWLRRPGHTPVHFAFAETARPDAPVVIALLRAMGLSIRLLSGDREGPVHRIAAQLGIDDWQSGCLPKVKLASIEALAQAGHKVLMVGDGLNDAPCLAAAHASMSPASAADLSQTTADLVFQGRALSPVLRAIAVARSTRAVMRQNIALAVVYNILAMPVAASGLVTPWLAAAAMSGSSLLVMANSLRLRGQRAG